MADGRSPPAQAGHRLLPPVGKMTGSFPRRSTRRTRRATSSRSSARRSCVAPRLVRSRRSSSGSTRSPRPSAIRARPRVAPFEPDLGSWRLATTSRVSAGTRPGDIPTHLRRRPARLRRPRTVLAVPRRVLRFRFRPLLGTQPRKRSRPPYTTPPAPLWRCCALCLRFRPLLGTQSRKRSPPEHASARSSMAGVLLASPFPATAGNATAETVAPSEHTFASSLFVGRDFGIRGFPQDRGPVTSSCECGAAVATTSGARPLGAIDAPLGEQPLKAPTSAHRTAGPGTGAWRPVPMREA